MFAKSSQFLALAGLAAVIAAPQVSYAYNYLYGGFGCSGNPYYLESDEAMSPRCTGVGGGTISLEWGSAQGDIAASAHWSWQQLNTSAPEIFMTRGPCTNEGISANNTNVEWLASSAFSFGRLTPSVDCFFFADPKLYSFDIEVNSGQQDKHTDCKTPLFTEDGTWVHELGHGYGQGHFDDWLSTMNTSQVDFSSCRSNFSMRPSSDAQQAADNHYRHGLPAAVDVGASAVITPAGCVLANSQCATAPSSTTFIGSGWTTGSVQFSAMNMRDAYPTSSIPFEVWLSSNNTVDGSDIWVGSWGVSGMSFAGAIYGLGVSYGFSGSWLTPGVRYCALVRFDPANAVAEFDESDNTVDTGYCFQR